MDSLTHIVIGAQVGEVFVGKRFGRKAMLFGAALQSLPDIDFVASFFLDPVEDIVAHRGFTHSILFAVLVVPLLAFFFKKKYTSTGYSLTRWLWFCSAELALHLFLDAFNAYGTGWFEPFSSARVSFNAIFVADPFFSIFPFISFLAILIYRKNAARRLKWIRFGLGMVCVYLTFSIISKLWVFSDVEAIAQKQGIEYNRYFTTPTPLNSILWFVVLENDSGYHIGYRSLFDTRADMDFEYFPRDAHLLQNFPDTHTVKLLTRFSQGFFVAQQWQDTLVFSDLRFGQMIGWKDPKASFTFYYFLNHKDDNELLIQRGRFKNWNREAVLSLLRRIRGQPNVPDENKK